MTDAPEDKPSPQQDATEIPHFSEIAPALEFIAWVFVLLCPLMRWANGPPVTDDQANIQIGLATVSVLSAVALRIYNWRAARRASRENQPPQP